MKAQSKPPADRCLLDHDGGPVHGLRRLPVGREQQAVRVPHAVQHAAVAVLVRTVPEAHRVVSHVHRSEDYSVDVVIHRNRNCETR